MPRKRLLCPCCNTPLDMDGIDVGWGMATYSQEWIGGCPGCGWQPGDPLERRRPHQKARRPSHAPSAPLDDIPF